MRSGVTQLVLPKLDEVCCCRAVRREAVLAQQHLRSAYERPNQFRI
jgi:hypothetical protein